MADYSCLKIHFFTQQITEPVNETLSINETLFFSLKQTMIVYIIINERKT
jgi:hypothetical protein